MSLVLSLAFPVVTARSTIASLASSSSVVARRTQRKLDAPNGVPFIVACDKKKYKTRERERERDRGREI